MLDRRQRMNFVCWYVVAVWKFVRRKVVSTGRRERDKEDNLLVYHFLIKIARKSETSRRKLGAVSKNKNRKSLKTLSYTIDSKVELESATFHSIDSTKE